MKNKKKPKKVKPRIKVAPPSKRHKSKKDYNRKANKQNKILDELAEETQKLGLYEAEFLDNSKSTTNLHLQTPVSCIGLETESPECQKLEKSWVDYFFSIFNFKRSK